MKNICRLGLLAIVILFGCSKPRQEKNSFEQIELIPVASAVSATLSEFLKFKKAIYLDFCDACVIGEIDKILVDDSGIYISDKNIGKSIKKFDFEGKLIFSIQDDGDGPGKYVLPFDFDLCDGKLLILDVNQRKILSFDKEDGKYLREERYGEFQANKFAALGNDIFAYHLDGRGMEPGLRQLSVLAENKKAISDAIAVWDYGNTDYMTVEQEFTRNKHGVLFAKSMNDTVYQITPRGFESKYIFDFGDRSINAEIKQMDMMEAMQTIMRDWPHFHWGRVFENDSKVLFLWSGNQGKKNLSIFDKRTKAVHIIDSEEYVPKQIFYLDDKQLMAYVTPEEYLETNIHGLVKEYKNPVILLYALR